MYYGNKLQLQLQTSTPYGVHQKIKTTFLMTGLAKTIIIKVVNTIPGYIRVFSTILIAILTLHLVKFLKDRYGKAVIIGKEHVFNLL